MENYKKEEVIKEFISNLQWNLRASYNSSACLNGKQCDYLEESLWELLKDDDEECG